MIMYTYTLNEIPLHLDQKNPRTKEYVIWIIGILIFEIKPANKKAFMSIYNE